jgi:hypothetical protein
MFNMDIYTWMFSLRPKIHEYTSVPPSRHKVSNLTTKWRVDKRVDNTWMFFSVDPPTRNNLGPRCISMAEDPPVPKMHFHCM